METPLNNPLSLSFQIDQRIANGMSLHKIAPQKKSKKDTSPNLKQTHQPPGETPRDTTQQKKCSTPDKRNRN